MSISYTGVYWGPRQESLEDCAEKIFLTFNFLREMDSSFNLWYPTRKPKKKEIIKAVDLNLEGIYNLLKLDRTYDDYGRLLDDLGYKIYLKSDSNFEKAHVLSITCSCSNEYVPNVVVLNLSSSKQLFYLREFTLVKSIYDKFAQIWDPEEGRIMDENGVNLVKPRI